MSDYTSTAATAIPVSISDVKEHLNITVSDDDALIDSYIKAATTMLEARTQRCFVAQTRVCKMQTFGDKRYVHDRVLYPVRSPLKSVTSIAYLNETGTNTTLPSSDYIVSTGERPGRISEAYNATWPDTYNVADDVTVTYVAGHSTVQSGVPDNIKHALKMLVGHWYRNREAVLTGINSRDLEWSIDALLESEAMESYG